MMPITAKITAVPIDDQPDLALETAAEEEPKTDAEKKTLADEITRIS